MRTHPPQAGRLRGDNNPRTKVKEMAESFAELFEQSLANSNMKPGAILRASVVAIRGDVVIVNAGLKS